MAVVLLILKIIGIILLSLIALALLILLILLFDPVRYSVRLKYYNQLNGVIKARWLFGIVGLKVIFINNDWNGYWRFFWNKHDFFEVKPLKIKSKKTKKDNTSTFDDDKEIDEYENVEVFDDDDISDLDLFSEKKIHVNSDNNSFEKKKQKRKKSFKFNFFKKMKSFYKRIKYIINKISSIIQNQSYQAAVKLLWSELIKDMKHIIPKKLKLNAEYSVGQPDKTALILGFVSMFPIGYQNDWKIYPDFECDQVFLKGYVKGKSSVIPFVLIKSFLRIYIDKNCRKLYNDFND